jgi:hypothetical protein
MSGLKMPHQRASRAHSKKASQELRLVDVEMVEQPPLPDTFVYADEDYEFHPQTIKWWNVWGNSPLAPAFTEQDWQDLLDTAIVHSKHWYGFSDRAAGELRSRMARFGATPLDRARLRIMFVAAEKAEETEEYAQQYSKDAVHVRRGALKSV